MDKQSVICEIDLFSPQEETLNLGPKIAITTIYDYF